MKLSLLVSISSTISDERRRVDVGDLACRVPAPTPAARRRDRDAARREQRRQSRTRR